MKPFTITKLRADVLEVFKDASQPLKAYDVLARLKETRPNAKPPTVYRVLEFLKDKHVIHEVSSQHAYVLCSGCDSDHAHCTHVLFVCRVCRQVEEAKASSLTKPINQFASQHQFNPTASIIELLGECHQCQ